MKWVKACVFVSSTCASFFYCSALCAVVTLTVMVDVIDVLWHIGDSSKVQFRACKNTWDFSVRFRSISIV